MTRIVRQSFFSFLIPFEFSEVDDLMLGHIISLRSPNFELVIGGPLDIPNVRPLVSVSSPSASWLVRNDEGFIAVVVMKLLAPSGLPVGASWKSPTVEGLCSFEVTYVLRSLASILG